MSGAALVGGYAADAVFGDPRRFHPVAGFGKLALAAERVGYAPTRARGALYACTLVASAALVAELSARAAQRTRPGRAGVLAVVTWAALGGRSLAVEARRLARRLQAGDLDGAREVLPSLCGRDPAGLEAEGLSRAAVESVAENTADAVVGALVWGAVAGPAGVAAYRAANTLDAMVGHRSERLLRFGWAAARLDDAANWPPSRACVLLVVALAPGRRRAAWRAAMRDGARHPSPNAGRVEGAFAGALGLRLGGVNRYLHGTEARPRLGDGAPPRAEDIARAVELSRRVAFAAAAFAALGARR
jgi:adenosylcobinamide-phosphate synthase